MQNGFFAADHERVTRIMTTLKPGDMIVTGTSAGIARSSRSQLSHLAESLSSSVLEIEGCGRGATWSRRATAGCNTALPNRARFWGRADG